MYEGYLQGFFVFAIVWLSFIATILWIASVRKTKQYGRELGDLYVAAKIKKIAKEDDLDLEVEKELFIEWDKKRRTKSINQNYDDVVEDEMKDKVSEAINTKSNKK